MVETALMAWLASREIEVHQLHLHRDSFPHLQSNAHAKHHQETLAHQDPKDRMDRPAMQVHQALMVNLEIKDQEDHLAHQDHLVALEKKDPLATPEESLARNQVQLAHLDRMANPAHLALPVDLAKLAEMAVLAAQALQAMLVLQAALANLAAQDHLAILATLVYQAVANTAHQLVWLQVIKTSALGASSWQRPKNSLQYYYSLPHGPQFGIT